LRVQTVSVVMSRSVFHINQSRLRPLEQLEQPFSDVPVWQLISCRNIVDLTWISFLNCEVDCTAKVVDEDPIANLSSSAIQRNVSPVQIPNGAFWNELLLMITNTE